MAEVGLAFLSASLSVLFDRMASPEVVDLMQGRKLTETLSWKLKTSVLSVNAVLADAEEKQLTDSSVKDWVDELKDVLFDAEDLLDEIATEALQRKLDAESSTTAEKVRDSTFLDTSVRKCGSISRTFLDTFVRKCGSISRTFLDTFVKEVEPKIQKVLDRLEHLAKQKDFMGLQPLGVGGKQYPERRSRSFVRESDTIGRDEDKKKVIDLLLSSDASGNKMCVIAIVGMGGIGKTTLAQLAYNDMSRVKQHFDLNIWCCVSEELDVPKVEISIIEAATSSPCNIEDHSELLQVTLEKHLNGKKFLLVLDDVWSEEPHNYQELLVQLSHYGNQGSKILVTTRSKKVALAMRAIETHHLKVLPKGDCWSLFEKHAFCNGSSNADPKIKEIGTKIVEKCEGLPLAIKAIGDLLRSESNVERWTKILMSNIWDLPMKGTNSLPALRLSYKYLPSYLKRCFAYCSIFPKDHIFEKDELVLLWMAEGFLQQSEIETMEEVGNRYFDALVSRSLFQQSIRGTNSGFVMHHLINDLAKSVAGQFGTDSLKKIVKMTRYVSYFCESWGTFQDIENDLLKAKQLRTFLTLRFSRVRYWEIKMPRQILCLRVLSLGSIGYWITKLPDSIGEMKYLRYLDVSRAKFIRLPDSICNLCNLQTLKLSSCSELDRLPRDMWKLINLRHLEIDGTDKLKEMPIKMGRLNCLQTLPKFVVSKHDSASGSSIGELEKLKNLRGKLLIQELQNVRSADDALDASLKDKGYLEKLVLEWNIPQVSESQRGVLENLQCHENLKSLSINCYSGKGFPDWIGGLTSLSELNLFDCKYCSALPPLGHLPFLEKLYIDGLDGVVTVGPEFYGNSSNSSMKPLGSLKILILANMSNWENWIHLGEENEVQTFSRLEELYIETCPKLRGRLPIYLPSLRKRRISDCQHLEGSLCIDSFPVPTSMYITRCDNYWIGGLTSLSELILFDCKYCSALPPLGHLPFLEKLYIDGLDGVVTVGPEFYGNSSNSSMKPLRSLKILILANMSNWENWIHLGEENEVQTFSRLEELYIETCPKLRGRLPVYLPSLRELRISDCQHLEGSLCIDSFPVLTSMYITRCDNLEFKKCLIGVKMRVALAVARAAQQFIEEDLKRKKGKRMAQDGSSPQHKGGSK